MLTFSVGSPVRCVKIKQLTNDTAMLSWLAPSQSHRPVYGYRIFTTERNKYQNNMFSIYDSPNFEAFIKEFSRNSLKRKILHLKTGVEYMFTIFPITKEYSYGFE